MIFLTSDLHNNFNHSGLQEYLLNGTENDLLIILGDIGLMFPESENYESFAEKFIKIKKPIAFLDGNHENFEYLYSLPSEKWNGGYVHRITDSIVHLIRGNVYKINGKSFFVMGGCESTQKWKDRGLSSTMDSPSKEEIKYGYESLSGINNRVDYVLTHKYMREENIEEENTLSALTEYIDENVNFKKWFCGHWHKDEKIDGKHIAIYQKLYVL